MICSHPSIIHCNVLQFVATKVDVLTCKVSVLFVVPNFTYFTVILSYTLQNLKYTLKPLFHWICMLRPRKILERQPHLNLKMPNLTEYHYALCGCSLDISCDLYYCHHSANIHNVIVALVFEAQWRQFLIFLIEHFSSFSFQFHWSKVNKISVRFQDFPHFIVQISYFLKKYYMEF